MTLDEMITRLSIIANIKACKKQDKESNETLQLMNWLIELKNFKKEEKKKINFLEEIIKAKDLEIKRLKSKLSEFDDDSYTDSINLKENVIMDKKEQEVVLNFGIATSFLVGEIEDVLEDYDYDGELTEKQLNRIRKRISVLRKHEKAFKELLRMN
ncbi:MAG: hypothetical protein E6862_14750 [Clostridium perfringens]|nr:hypothetical protein [Clostridium perfringens]